MAGYYDPAGGMMLRAQVGMAVSNFIDNIPNMSDYEIAYVFGYGVEKLAESVALTRGLGLSTNVVRGSRSFIQFSSKIGRSQSGQKVFSFQTRFPKSNLNVRLDRGFRAPFKNTRSNYLGKPYNGFNTHINIQKPGTFNYHFPLNPLKWKYYNIP